MVVNISNEGSLSLNKKICNALLKSKTLFELSLCDDAAFYNDSPPSIDCRTFTKIQQTNQSTPTKLLSKNKSLAVTSRAMHPCFAKDVVVAAAPCSSRRVRERPMLGSPSRMTFARPPFPLRNFYLQVSATTRLRTGFPRKFMTFNRKIFARRYAENACINQYFFLS